LIAKVGVAGDDPQAMQERMAQWQSVLINLGEQFADGNARVDPKSREVCRNCGLPALCRIAELRNGNEDDQ
jgi:hypothetical protein